MKRLLFILGLMLAAAAAEPAFARGGSDGGGHEGGGANGGNGEGQDRQPDQDRARSAVEGHEILPLPRVVSEVRRSFGGRVIEVNLERKRGRYVYELKLISADGRIVEVEVDAATGVAVDEGEAHQDGKED